MNTVDDMELEKIDIAALTIGKAEQLTADALLSGPLDITITGLKPGPTPEQPLAIYYEGSRLPYVPCLSMRRVLLGLWGQQLVEWKGRRIRLYRDAGVSYGGQRVAGIRISHLSHIEREEEWPLTLGRGKKIAYRVKPLPRPHSEGRAGNAAAPSMEAGTARSASLPIEHLRKEGLESAGKGSEELKKFWAWLGKEEKAALKPDLDKDWKAIAQKADETAESRKEEFPL